jgi:hypothetical protein
MMTRLKPTVSQPVLDKMKNRVEELSKQTAECMAIVSETQGQLELLSYGLRMSPESSTERSDNGLRSVHIIGVDGSRRVHRS